MGWRGAWIGYSRPIKRSPIRLNIRLVTRGMKGRISWKDSAWRRLATPLTTRRFPALEGAVTFGGNRGGAHHILEQAHVLHPMPGDKIRVGCAGTQHGDGDAGLCQLGGDGFREAEDKCFSRAVNGVERSRGERTGRADIEDFAMPAGNHRRKQEVCGELHLAQ